MEMDGQPSIPGPRPDIIVADVGPLFQLAQSGQLSLLHEVGNGVVVADMVAYEATLDLEKPGSVAIRDWLAAGQEPRTSAPILIAETPTGNLFMAALKGEPNYPLGKLGNFAVMEWLADYVGECHRRDLDVLILYEDGKVPRYVYETSLDLETEVVTTRAFLEVVAARRAPL